MGETTSGESNEMLFDTRGPETRRKETHEGERDARVYLHYCALDGGTRDPFNRTGYKATCPQLRSGPAGEFTRGWGREKSVFMHLRDHVWSYKVRKARRIARNELGASFGCKCTRNP